MKTRTPLVTACLLAAGLLLFACGVESIPDDSLAAPPANDSGSGSDPTDDGTQDDRAGRRVFFSFGTGAPDDPQKMKDFLVDQVQKVAAAMGKVKDPSVDSTVLLGAAAVTPASVKARLTAYAQTLGAGDTFVMYSHGHGNKSGLLLDFDAPGAGVLSWKELAELILTLPAKNVLVFTMSCHSGTLADLLKTSEYVARWQGRRAGGRSLVVMTAVAADEVASATDLVIGDPGGIGNPFTYAVRTALDGLADGFSAAPTGGAADGVTTLKEARDYILFTSKAKAKDGQHNPQLAGECVETERFPTAP